MQTTVSVKTVSLVVRRMGGSQMVQLVKPAATPFVVTGREWTSELCGAGTGLTWLGLTAVTAGSLLLDRRTAGDMEGTSSFSVEPFFGWSRVP